MPKNSHTIIAPVSGLEIGAPGTLIDQRNTPNCKNVEINRSLIRKIRGGDALGVSLGERILGYGTFQELGVNYIARVGPTKIQKLVGTTWSSIAHAALTATAGDTVDFSYPVLSGSKVMVFSNFVDNIRKWTGVDPTDADLGGTPPKAKFLLYYSGYLLLAYIDDAGDVFRSRVQWPDAGDPESWVPSVASDAGSTDLLEDDLDITGMAYFGDFVAIHKYLSIYLGYHTDTDQIFKFDRKNTGAGTMAFKTILNLPTGEQIFLSRQGLRLFNGVTAPLISSNINIELAESVSPQYGYRSWGVIVKELNEAWFGIPIGTSQNPDTIYKYNYLTKQVFRDSIANLSVASLFAKTADDSWDSDSESWDSDLSSWDSVTSLALNLRVVWGDSSGNSVERVESANYAGAAIESNWDSKDYTANDFAIDDPEGLLLEWQGIEVIAKGSTVSVYYSLDEGGTWTFAKTLALGSSYPTDSAPLMVYFRKASTKLRVRFYDNTAGGSFNIKQFRLLAIPREARRV